MEQGLPLSDLVEDKLSFNVNEKLVGQVIQTLSAWGVKDAAELVASWNSKKFYAISLFSQASALQKLPEKLEECQIEAFLGLLKLKNYGRCSLVPYWNTIKSIANNLHICITKKHQRMFEVIASSSKEIRDDRLPVSAALLTQLCNATDLNFREYTASLVKALFTCAWAFSMRVSEYSETVSKGTLSKVSHNI